MTVYKIQIAPALYKKLGLVTLTFPSKAAAIRAINEALVKKDMKFTIKAGNDSVSFINKSGGELAIVVPGK